MQGRKKHQNKEPRIKASRHLKVASKLGRKPLPLDVARSERIVTFVTPKEKRQLEELAGALSQSISAVCHRLLARALRAES